VIQIELFGVLYTQERTPYLYAMLGKWANYLKFGIMAADHYLIWLS